MKKTTVTMICAAIFFLICGMAASAIIVRKGVSVSGNTVEIAPAPMTSVSLRSFSAVRLRHQGGRRAVWVDEFGGLAIDKVPADSANRVYFPEELKRYLNLDYCGDTLEISFMIPPTDTVPGSPDFKRHPRFICHTPLRLGLAQAPSSVDIEYYCPVAINGFSGGDLSLNCTSPITFALGDCSIRQISLGSRRDITLSLKDTEVSYLNIPAKSERIKLDGDSLSTIGSVAWFGGEGSDLELRLNGIKPANIHSHGGDLTLKVNGITDLSLSK